MSFAANQLRNIVEGIERLASERDAITADIKEAKATAKDQGFDIRIIEKILRIRKMEPERRAEEEALLGVYLAALGMLPNDDTQNQTGIETAPTQKQDTQIPAVVVASSQQEMAEGEGHADVRLLPPAPNEIPAHAPRMEQDAEAALKTPATPGEDAAHTASSPPIQHEAEPAAAGLTAPQSDTAAAVPIPDLAAEMPAFMRRTLTATEYLGSG